MKKHIRAFVSLLGAAALALGCASCGGAAQSTGKSGGTAGVTHITVWNYYNGDQLESFNKLVDQFNETTGREKGIRVESASQGSMSDLETNVMDAAQGKVGAAAMPNIFSAYADTAYALDQMGMLVDLSQYLTEDERAQYVQGYLDEGDFDGDGSMKIFPVAKSTELMFLNETDWEKFARATGAAYDDLSTVEGLVATAGAYYDWTDAQTPEPDDGKALFGRDAMANYMLVGARQLGDTLFEVQDGKMTLNFDKDVARKLWDNYYVPFVKGWFAAIGRFRSDDIKVGNVLAYVGSNSSATFFPTQVVVNDTESYDIDMTVLPSPKFAGGEDVAVQQGAGMVVTAGTEEEINASVEFLKWFTQPENNISFSVDSGYLPVTTAANDMEAIKTSGLELSPKMESILSNAVQSVKNNTLYMPSAFAGGNKARKVLEYSLSDLASADRATVQERVAAGQPPPTRKRSSSPTNTLMPGMRASALHWRSTPAERNDRKPTGKGGKCHEACRKVLCVESAPAREADLPHHPLFHDGGAAGGGDPAVDRHRPDQCVRAAEPERQADREHAGAQPRQLPAGYADQGTGAHRHFHHHQQPDPADAAGRHHFAGHDGPEQRGR